MPDRHLTKSTSRIEWLIVLLTVGLGALFVAGFRGTPPFHPGFVRNITITVVPEDAHRLKCFEKRKTQNLSCEGRSPDRLSPFVTTERELILLAGVFAHPAVKTEVRLRQRARGNQRRFSVHCSVDLLEYTRSHQVQFGPRSPREPAAAWIGKTLDCSPVPKRSS